MGEIKIAANCGQIVTPPFSGLHIHAAVMSRSGDGPQHEDMLSFASAGMENSKAVLKCVFEEVNYQTHGATV